MKTYKPPKQSGHPIASLYLRKLVLESQEIPGFIRQQAQYIGQGICYEFGLNRVLELWDKAANYQQTRRGSFEKVPKSRFETTRDRAIQQIMHVYQFLQENEPRGPVSADSPMEQKAKRYRGQVDVSYEEHMARYLRTNEDQEPDV